MLPCLRKSPYTLFWLLPRYACSLEEVLETQGLRAVPVREETGLREQLPLSLFNHVCREVSGQLGASAASPSTDVLPLLPSCWATRPPSNNACHHSEGLELHKVGLVLRAMAGESLAHAPNGCAINRTYQRNVCVSV